MTATEPDRQPEDLPTARYHALLFVQATITMVRRQIDPGFRALYPLDSDSEAIDALFDSPVAAADFVNADHLATTNHILRQVAIAGSLHHRAPAALEDDSPLRTHLQRIDAAARRIDEALEHGPHASATIPAEQFGFTVQRMIYELRAALARHAYRPPGRPR